MKVAGGKRVLQERARVYHQHRDAHSVHYTKVRGNAMDLQAQHHSCWLALPGMTICPCCALLQAGCDALQQVVPTQGASAYTCKSITLRTQCSRVHAGAHAAQLGPVQDCPHQRRQPECRWPAGNGADEAHQIAEERLRISCRKSGMPTTKSYSVRAVHTQQQEAIAPACVATEQ